MLEGKYMRVLIIGSGGREHALSWKISRGGKAETIYCAPGNGGTARPPPRVRGDKIVALSLPAWDGETAGSVASGTAAPSSRLAAEGRVAS